MANDDVVNAINDLTRVMIALNGKFVTKADAVRGLYELAIPPTRIGAILAMEPKAVHTVISRMKQARKTDSKKSETSEVSNGEES
jgi:hypothetical protein